MVLVYQVTSKYNMGNYSCKITRINHWTWYGISKNPNITWDVIVANPDKDWDWEGDII